MLTKEFIIKDLFDYMLSYDVDILEELANYSISTLLDLIRIGNKCSDDEALELMNIYFDKYGYEKTFEMIAYEIIGRKPEDSKDGSVDNKNLTYSDILEKFFNEIQTVDNKLTLSEYLNMSTKFMYKYADGIKERYIYNINSKSEEQFMNASTFLGLLFGKLNEPIKLDIDGNIKKDSLKDKIAKLKNREV